MIRSLQSWYWEMGMPIDGMSLGSKGQRLGLGLGLVLKHIEGDRMAGVIVIHPIECASSSQL